MGYIDSIINCPLQIIKENNFEDVNPKQICRIYQDHILTSAIIVSLIKSFPKILLWAYKLFLTICKLSKLK